jgi:membrane fusion protein
LYDAFPYQRFGVRFGNVRWVGPATVGPTRDPAIPGDPQAFRALIDPSDTTINVRGEPRPLLVGMRGRVRVVTGQRTLISFAFEPIRALRENLSTPPAAAQPPSPSRSSRPAS